MDICATSLRELQLDVPAIKEREREDVSVE